MANVYGYAQLVSASASAGWLSMSPYDVISVKDYGAKGDGVTDDTSAIRSCCADAVSGVTIFFPRGSYKISGTITIPAGVSVQLTPNSTLVLSGFSPTTYALSLGAGCALLGGSIDATATASNVVQIAGDNVTVQSVRFTGGRHVVNADTANTGYHRTKVLDCWFQDWLYVAVRLVASNGPFVGINVSGNHFDRRSVPVTSTYDTPSAILLLGATGAFTMARISNNSVMLPAWDYTAGVSAGWIVGLCTRNANYTTYEGNVIHGGSMGISVDTSSHCSVTGNTLRYGGGLEIVKSDWVSCTGNTVDLENVNWNGGNNAGITANSSSWVSITGNTVSNLPSGAVAGVYVTHSGNGTSGSGVVIAGNVIRNGLCNSGIYSNGCGDLTVTGNLIDGQSVTNGRAVYIVGNATGFTGGQRFTVTGNQGFNLPLCGTYYFGSGVAANLTVTGNNFAGARAILLGGGGTVANTGISVSGNDDGVDYVNLASNVIRASGAGSPEGSQTAGVGSIWVRTDGGASSTLYVKETGTGNTGWVAK